jgi:hypothetical protein
MMRNFTKIGLCFSFFFTACNKESKTDDLELALLNENIICYSKSSDKDSINVVKYSLRNNSKKVYFINNLTDQEDLSKKAVYNNGINLRIFSDNNIETKYQIKRYRNSNLDIGDCINFLINNFEAKQEKLGNKNSSKFFGLHERNNIFFIHPNETVFFEYTLNLNKPTVIDGVREGFVSLDNNTKYYATLSIASDSSNYKDVIPKDILKTIEANNVKVYHGIIESKDKVPVKVLE